MNLSALEGAGFQVITHSVIDVEVTEELPGILEIEAVNVVFGCDLTRSNRESESGWRPGSIHNVLTEVELREE